MKKIALATLGASLFIATIYDNNFLSELFDWSNGQMIGSNIAKLLFLIGGPYLVYLGFKKESTKENAPKEKILLSFRRYLPYLLVVILLMGVYLLFFSNQKEGLVLTQVPKNTKQLSVSGHWRNDTAKVDYIFSDSSNYLSVVREKNSSECTYEITKNDSEKESLEVWFKCPTVDWPGYAEFHTFKFTDNKDFVDTISIQGIPNRVDGNFTKVGK